MACGQCIIAGAVGVWFFTQQDKEKRDKAASRSAVCSSIKNALGFHFGSLAFGSFILAVVQFLKYFMQWLSKQAKAQPNKCMEVICKCLSYCLWCFEKCVKFLNKNAYIQIALMGTSFCASAKAAFDLIVRNMVRFGLLGGLGTLLHVIGKWFIGSCAAVLGFFLLRAMHSDLASPAVLVFIHFCIGYIVGALFMNVYALAVDSCLQCLIAAEELETSKAIIPKGLRQFVESKNDDRSSCCGCC